MTTSKITTVNVIIFTGVCLLDTLPVSAVTQGSLGATSSGQISISLTTDDQIKVSNLKDIMLIKNPNGDFAGTSPACIYRNGSGTYSITASGSGPGNTYTLTNGGSNTLAYSVTYDDGTGAHIMQPTTSLKERINADTKSVTCSGGDNADINVIVFAENANPSPGETYTGTLMLTVSPE